MGKKSASTPFLPRPPACLADETKLEDEARAIQARLREIFTQLWDENATFQRIMYKNQNQHRRTLYFRRLTQVRRDLLLLQTMLLPEAVDALIEKKKQQLSREEVLRRLLGGARLLELMADPILAAGAAMEGLLSQSFFMPFALTVLAMLARLRALLVQGLYEVIAAFNLVSTTLQNMEVVVSVDAPLLLECTWDGVKLTFSEKPRPIPELIPLPTDATTSLPDAGWFIDDRFTREKLHVKSAPEPVLYEREEGFILEGEEDDEAIPTLCDANGSLDVGMKTEMAVDVVSTPVEVWSSVDSGQLEESSVSAEAKAELESWKAELESWGKSKGAAEKSPPVSTKKRVAYVSVQIGGAKAPKTSIVGEEDDEAMPTLGDAIGTLDVRMKTEMAVDVVSTPIFSEKVRSSVGSGQLKESSVSAEAKAELESWKAELESWGKSKGAAEKSPHVSTKKSVEEPHVSTKKRVAYVSVQIGSSKVPKTGHPL